MPFGVIYFEALTSLPNNFRQGGFALGVFCQSDLLAVGKAMVAHVASQLTQHYYPIPNGPVIPGSSEKFLSTLNQTDWAHWIRELQETQGLPWLSPLLVSRPELTDRIAFCCSAEIKVIKENKASLVLSNSTLYPPLLREISDPPHALTIRGDLSALAGPSVAIVGARKASGFALRESFLLGKSLSLKGYIVVSGGAMGCDIAVHQGVLAGGVRPAPIIVVFAGGLSATYPRINEHVFRRVVAEGGALVSERLWWSPPKPRDFAARNRIVSGLAPDVFVMQAGERSGALITARTALDQGREVWVMEHDANDVRAQGGRMLIEQGAKTFRGAQDFH